MTIATFNEIAALSTAEVSDAWRRYYPYDQIPTKKSVACHDLAKLALDRGLTLADLRRAAAPAAPQAVDAVMLNTADAALRQHIEDHANALGARLAVLNSRINDNVTDLGREMKTQRDSQVRVNVAFNDSLTTLSDQIDALAAQPKVNIDQAAIDAAVAAQVDAAFGAFKSAVVAASERGAGLPETV